MAKVTPITEQFQHFVRDLKESFWGDLYGKTRLAWERFWEEESRQARDRYLVTESYERVEEGRRGYRNGYYERDFVTRLGTLRLRIARSRDRSGRLYSRLRSARTIRGCTYRPVLGSVRPGRHTVYPAGRAETGAPPPGLELARGTGRPEDQPGVGKTPAAICPRAHCRP